MSQFEDNLWQAVVDQHGDDLARADIPVPGHSRRTRPRVLAGGTLGLAGVAAILTIAFSGAASAPALAVTRETDGTVLVKVNTDERTQPWVEAANQKLASMGINEQINVETSPGPATTSGAISCEGTAGPGLVRTSKGLGYQPGTPSGPPVKVLLATDGTDAVPSGTTGSSMVHLVSCIYYNDATGPDGNSGPGSR